MPYVWSLVVNFHTMLPLGGSVVSLIVWIVLPVDLRDPESCPDGSRPLLEIFIFLILM